MAAAQWNRCERLLNPTEVDLFMNSLWRGSGGSEWFWRCVYDTAHLSANQYFSYLLRTMLISLFESVLQKWLSWSFWLTPRGEHHSYMGEYNNYTSCRKINSSNDSVAKPNFSYRVPPQENWVSKFHQYVWFLIASWSTNRLQRLHFCNLCE